MGQIEEKHNVDHFSKIREDKSILEIINSTLEQNIYICGNYDIGFFVINIIETLLYPKKSNITNYIYMASHKNIKEWHFFSLQKKINLMK